MSKNTIVKVACDIYWASTSKPAALSSKYELTLANLSDTAVTNLKGMGIPVRFREDKPEQGQFTVCKSSLPIEVVDQYGAKIDGRIGNGSKAIATVSPYSWTFKNKEGISASLKKLVVTDLVSVGGDDDSDMEAV